MPRGGSSIIFGKIQIVSETENLDAITKKLEEIIRDIGYPADAGLIQIDDVPKQKLTKKAALDMAEQHMQDLLKPEGDIDGDSQDGGN
jgi:hypothetical protein